MDTSSSNSSSSSPSQQPQSGADSPQQVPPPPSPASPDMVVDPAPSTPKPTDVTVPPQPPSTITAMEEVVDDKMISTTPTASEPAEVPVTATVSSMAVSEEDQGVAALSDGARGDGAGGAGVAAAAPAAVSMPTIDRRVAAGAATAIETPVTRPVQKSRKRCFACHKKVCGCLMCVHYIAHQCSTSPCRLFQPGLVRVALSLNQDRQYRNVHERHAIFSASNALIFSKFVSSRRWFLVEILLWG